MAIVGGNFCKFFGQFSPVFGGVVWEEIFANLPLHISDIFLDAAALPQQIYIMEHSTETNILPSDAPSSADLMRHIILQKFFCNLIIDLLMGLFRGAVFHSGGAPGNSTLA